MTRKFLLSLIMILAVLLTISVAYAADNLSFVYDLPEEMEAQYEQMKEQLHQKVLKAESVKGTGLVSQPRALGYEDTDYCGSMALNYKTNWAQTKPGNVVSCSFEALGGTPPYLVAYGWVIYDEDKNIIEDYQDAGISTASTASKTMYCTPDVPGYVGFIIVVSDNSGQKISVATNLVQIRYSWDTDAFDTIGFADDNAFAAGVNLDQKSIDVGDTIRATYYFTISDEYTGPYTVQNTWYLVDTYNNVLDLYNVPQTLYGQGAYYTDFVPLQAGWIYYSLSIVDAYGRDVHVDTPKIKVEGAAVTATPGPSSGPTADPTPTPTPPPLSVSISVNKTSLLFGQTVTATYSIQDKTGEYLQYEAHWFIEHEGKEVYQEVKLDGTSGTITFKPEFGESVYLYIYAWTPSYEAWAYSDTITLRGEPLREPVSVTASLDKSEIALGEPITVTYEVKNNNGTPNVNVDFFVVDDGREYSAHYVYDLTETTGSVTFTPTYGDSVYAYVWVSNAGDEFSDDYTTESATIIGESDYTPIRIELTGGKASYEIGETITLNYETIGGTVGERVTSYYWTIYDEDWNSSSTDTMYLDGPKGQIQYTPYYGVQIELTIYAYDGTSDFYEYYEFELTGDSMTEAFNIKLEPNKSSVAKGEKVTVSYEVTGGSGVDEVLSAFYIIEKDGYVYGTEDIELTKRTGSLSFTPRFGDTLTVYVKARDKYVEEMWEAVRITLTGSDKTTPPVASVNFEKEPIVLGEAVNVKYSLSGGTAPYDAALIVRTWSEADNTTDIYTKKLTSAGSGTVTVTPESGEQILAFIEGTDDQGFTIYGDWLWLELEAPAAPRVPGDADDNGVVNTADAVAILAYCVDASKQINQRNADVNADELVDVYDALLLLQYDAGWNVKLE